ncbi:MAG TPA: hypothetical protein PK347_04890 [Burkholderiaceae bacterium]|nr:hypothetical protein [Burkholderiaceae bacterium]
MEFKIVYGNHGKDPFHIMDTLLLIKYSLQEIGHKADIQEQMTPGKANILMEYFTYDFIEAMKEIKEVPGTQFILVATEFLTGDTFNDFQQTDAVIQPQSHYDWSHFWRKRYKTFTLAQKMSTAIWHLASNQVPIYQNMFSSSSVFYLPHGYTDAFGRVVQVPWAHKDIDAIFTGTLTPHRLKVVECLKQNGINALAVKAVNSVVREDLVGRSKIGINLKQNESWLYPSNSRFHYHLSNRSIMLTEHCPESCDLNAYVTNASENNFTELCMQMIGKGDLQNLADDSYIQFREEMPMRVLMKDLIEQTFAV